MSCQNKCFALTIISGHSSDRCTPSTIWSDRFRPCRRPVNSQVGGSVPSTSVSVMGDTAVHPTDATRFADTQGWKRFGVNLLVPMKGNPNAT